MKTYQIVLFVGKKLNWYQMNHKGPITQVILVHFTSAHPEDVWRLAQDTKTTNVSKV